MRAKFPCINCLVLPACKTKKTIKCSLLTDYYFLSTDGHAPRSSTISMRRKRMQTFFGDGPTAFEFEVFLGEKTLVKFGKRRKG